MEIVKKILCLLAVVVLILVGLYNVNKVRLKNNAIDLALDVSDEIANLYKDDLDISKIVSYLDSKSKGSVDKYIENLKAKDDIAFNLTEYYNSVYNGEESEDVADDVLDPVSEEAKGYVVDESFLVDESTIAPPINDSRIYRDKGNDFVKVKDLVFEDGLTYIDYNGVSLLLDTDMMPLTYDNIVKSKDFRFTLKDYSVKNEKGCYNIGVEYISLNNVNRLKVNLKIDSNVVKDIKIEVVESRVNNE